MGGHLCNDWRITNQMNYLFRARLIKTTFSESSHSDHEHSKHNLNGLSLMKATILRVSYAKDETSAFSRSAPSRRKEVTP